MTSVLSEFKFNLLENIHSQTSLDIKGGKRITMFEDIYFVVFHVFYLYFFVIRTQMNNYENKCLEGTHHVTFLLNFPSSYQSRKITF